MSSKKIFAVAGNPILFSKSPIIFRKGFKILNENSTYLRILASSCEQIYKLSKDLNINGLNITSPFKKKIIRYVDTIDKKAEDINAVNTICFGTEKSVGYNTDYLGVINSFKKNNIKLKGEGVIILGAGGAARAAILGAKLLKANITIVNRTPGKAEELANRFNCKFSHIEEINDLLKINKVLISCITTEKRIIDPITLNEKHIVLDANYRKSILVEDAKKRGSMVIDGLYWLLYQALPCFKLFIGKNVPEKEIKNLLLANNNEDENKYKNITLIGYMGTGKSSLGKRLAEKLNMKFVDTDELIEKHYVKKIPDIFRDEGEKKFRIIESKTLKRVLNSKNNVIATGGGAVCNKEIRKLIYKNSIVVWLWSSLKSSLDRLNSNAIKRPLLKRDNRYEMAEKLLKQRIFYYAETADILIQNEGDSLENICERIYYEISKIL